MKRWRLAILLALAFAVSGCGSSPDGDDTTPARAKGDEAGKSRKGNKKTHGSEAIQGEPDPDPVSAKGKSWDGWQWKGKRDNCFFVVGKRCFDDLDRACKAARCAKQGKKCKTRGGGPATVECK